MCSFLGCEKAKKLCLKMGVKRQKLCLKWAVTRQKLCLKRGVKRQTLCLKRGVKRQKLRQKYYFPRRRSMKVSLSCFRFFKLSKWFLQQARPQEEVLGACVLPSRVGEPQLCPRRLRAGQHQQQQGEEQQQQQQQQQQPGFPPSAGGGELQPHRGGGGGHVAREWGGGNFLAITFVFPKETR